MDTLLNSPMEQVTQDSISGVSRLELSGTYYVKCFKGRKSRVEYLFGTSRFQRELKNLLYFQRLGLRTPELVAHGKKGLPGFLKSGVMVTLEAESATDLQAYLEAGKLYEHGVAAARRLLGQLAHATRLLHEDGFYHWDLKTRNVLVSTKEDEPKLYFFDCPRGYRPLRPLFRRCVVRELAHLERGLKGHLRAVDLLWLYKQYRGCQRLSAEDKALARDALSYYATRRMNRERRERMEKRNRK